MLLCTNVTGTERLKPLICGKVVRPRVWGRASSPSSWSPDKYVKWVKTPKAWRNKETFNSWLNDMREDFKRQGRTAFIIMDNAGAHKFTHWDEQRAVVRHITISLLHIVDSSHSGSHMIIVGFTPTRTGHPHGEYVCHPPAAECYCLDSAA